MAKTIQQQSNVVEINQHLDALSKQILPDGLHLKYVGIDELHEQKINPRSMPQRMFDQLIDNIKNVGAMESIPLCVYVDNQIEIISGHHRVRAARAAGIKEVLIMVYDELDHSRLRSKQLAHNTISGVDDPELVKRIWAEILDVQAQFEAFVDPKALDLIPDPVKFKPIDVDMQAIAKTVVVIFLPSQAVDFKEAIDSLLPSSQVDTVYLASAETYEAWKEAINAVREDCDIVSAPTAIAEMARLAVKYLAEHSEES
jgi:hypothetical protein